MNTRRIPNTNYYDPFFIGFDSVFNKMNQVNTMKDHKYPPYNIIKLGEDRYLLEMAVAGFGEDDFDITVQDGILTINGSVDGVDEDAEYLHKGIATRSFSRAFTMADSLRVERVTLDKGVLAVRLVNVVPDDKKPQKFTVNGDVAMSNPVDLRG